MVEQFTQSDSSTPAVAEGISDNGAARAVTQITPQDIKDAMDAKYSSAASRQTESALPAFGITNSQEGTAGAGGTLTPNDKAEYFERISRDELNELFRTQKPGIFKEIEPLSKTENKMVAELHKSLTTGDAASTQNMLRKLAADPKTAERVMNELQRQLEKGHPERTVGWAIGKDENGNKSIVLKVTSRHGDAKDAPVTSVSMSSDHPARATYYKNGQAYKMDVESSLQSIMAAPLRKK